MIISSSSLSPPLPAPYTLAHTLSQISHMSITAVIFWHQSVFRALRLILVSSVSVESFCWLGDALVILRVWIASTPEISHFNEWVYVSNTVLNQSCKVFIFFALTFLPQQTILSSPRSVLNCLNLPREPCVLRSIELLHSSFQSRSTSLQLILIFLNLL